MNVRGVAPGCIVELKRGSYAQYAEVLSVINEHVNKLVLLTSRGILMERVTKCRLVAIKSGNNYISLDGEIIDEM